LSDQALEALAALFAAFELAGSWCETLNLVLIVLLPKKPEGFRPIGLFPTLLRIWMRARVCTARAWEAVNALPSLFGGDNMGAHKAAWQAAFAAEAAAFEDQEHAQGLLDLVKAFESVPHQELVRAAIDKGYCLILLRLSLQAYRLTRSIGIGGVYSRHITATRGITAGSGFATSELRLLMLGLMQALQDRWVGILIVKLYVDDMTLAVCGTPRQVVRLMITIIDFVVEWLEDTLHMEVSASKSKVLSGRLPIALAIEQGTKTSKVTATTHAKLLGTDSVGGRRRSTKCFQDRLQTFKSTAPRYHAMRASGVNSVQMVRTAGVPAVMYGCEVFGISDSTLHSTRATFAATAAPKAGGKNPDLTLLALDGPSGTIDPAFEAHTSPLKHWALAWWEGWFNSDTMSSAFTAAALKLSGAKGSEWQSVTGPTAALLASIKRIGWTMPSAWEITDDAGCEWDFRVDSPAAIVTACKDSVRRWRLARVGKILPGLIPDHCDVGDPNYPCTMLVDCSGPTAALIACKGTASKNGAVWERKWCGDLASAVSGGQWTQTRKAQVAAWGINDTRCQLCLEAPGTLAHRSECSASKPAGGWPAPPKEAGLALGRLSARRKTILKERGLLVLRVPAPPPQADGHFSWLVEPRQTEELSGATWYFDGSMIHGKWKSLRATGFGLVVVSKQGSLLGYGNGVPPHWCRTAASAEAWALQTVVSLCPFPPEMRTDCLSLLRTAEHGSQDAVHPRKQLARVWQIISNNLDGNLQALTDNQVLVWMPAHQTVGMVGEAKLSNNQRLTLVDWRANRLVDFLAKLAAAERQLSSGTVKLMDSATVAVRDAACLLGRVTHAANNHRVTVTDGNGNSVVQYVRDATPAPKGHRSGKKRAASPEPVPSVPKKLVHASVKPWSEPRAPNPARVHRASVRAFSEACVVRRVNEIGASSTASGNTVPAATRMEGLWRRVRGRSGSLS
jgi:hypothetical protein